LIDGAVLRGLLLAFFVVYFLGNVTQMQRVISGVLVKQYSRKSATLQQQAQHKISVQICESATRNH
jgi:hypothetical protein